MSLDFFLSHYFFSFCCSYQHAKVDWLVLCKCFFIENNIDIYCVQFHTNILTWSKLSLNVTLSINKRVKEILTRS